MAGPESLSRRKFLGIATVSIGGLISLGYIIPGIKYIVAPAARKKEVQDWIRLGSTDKVEIGTPTLFKVVRKSQVGWIVNEEEITVYVITNNGRDYSSLSNICTHLGCRVRWISDKKEFFCPCHNGVFDANGNVISGPPPKPLEQYETKVENGQLFIKVG
jgi:menaquinol-cytochrome c reductase iron-sulfur subunit